MTLAEPILKEKGFGHLTLHHLFTIKK